MIAVDTSILLSIFKGEQDGSAWLSKLQAAAPANRLIVCPVVVSEIRAYFKKDVDCQNTLAALGITMSPFSEQSALLAGSIFGKYRQNGGPRKTILPDFLVAAHASKQASLFASTDRGYFRTYFPKLRLLSLCSHR